MNRVATTGIVLTRTNFGEHDRILTVMTPDHGKIRLMAKGVRRVGSKLAGGIELFSISNITFIIGRGDIYTLISSRLQQHFGNIVHDVNRTMLGYEIIKALHKATEDNAGPEYFTLLAAALEGLNDENLNVNALELWFDIQLLEANGHVPNLQTDTAGHKLAATSKYNFDPDKMAFAPSPRGAYSANHLRLLRLVYGLDNPTALKRVRDIDDVLSSCLTLIKNILGSLV